MSSMKTTMTTVATDDGVSQQQQQQQQQQKQPPMTDVDNIQRTTTTTNSSSSNNNAIINIEHRVEQILKQNRNVLNFIHYKASQNHLERMELLSTNVPELYNNPNITSRSKWFTHPLYKQNSQMPPYHIHFRIELQTSIKFLYNAYQQLQLQQQQQQQQMTMKKKKEQERENNVSSSSSSSEQNQKQRQQIQMMIQRSYDIFRGSMRGLHGHVSIEEYACFPLYEGNFPNVDISFLYHDHQQLHQSENNVMEAFNEVLLMPSSGFLEEEEEEEGTTLKTISALLNTLLDFDDELMSHLGEEEEIVVPMSLTEKEIWF